MYYFIPVTMIELVMLLIVAELSTMNWVAPTPIATMLKVALVSPAAIMVSLVTLIYYKAINKTE